MAKKRYSPKVKFQVVLEGIARRHPGYGYRRTTPELRERTGRRINHKVAQTLRRAWGLPLIRCTRTPKPSGIRRVITAAGNRINLVAGRQDIRPMEVAYTDFTLRAHRMDVGAAPIHHDQDPVFTSYAWTARLLVKDQVRVSYAQGGAQDNTEMEAFNSRFKTENRSLLLDAQSLTELKQLVAERMVYYNNIRRHSSIGYRAPSQYIATLQPWT